MSVNRSDEDKEVAILPDGNVDVLFICKNTKPFRAALMDLEREPSQVLFSAKTAIRDISFKLLAVE